MIRREHLERGLKKRAATARLGLRGRLTKTMVVNHDGHRCVFRCGSLDEWIRVESLLYKEPGTIELLRTELREGDVFYDIGANIGIYSVPAALAVGPTGCVVAFEPHAANFESLLRNVGANALTDRVRALSCALHDAPGFFDFSYDELEPGTSMSQLHSQHDTSGRRLSPEAVESKYATTVDALLESGLVPRPDVVKIDVDGNELLVLRGMGGVLGDGPRPRAVQVEVNVAEADALLAFMDESGYELAERHHTEGVQQALDAGADPGAIPYNGVFRPRP